MTDSRPLVARRIYVWLTDEQSDQIDELANYWSASRAAVCHRAISAYLNVWRDVPGDETQQHDGNASSAAGRNSPFLKGNES